MGGAKAWRSRDKRRYEMRELTSDDEAIGTPAKRRSKRSQLSYYTGEDDGDPDAYRARIQYEIKRRLQHLRSINI